MKNLMYALLLLLLTLPAVAQKKIKKLPIDSYAESEKELAEEYDLSGMVKLKKGTNASLRIAATNNTNGEEGGGAPEDKEENGSGNGGGICESLNVSQLYMEAYNPYTKQWSKVGYNTALCSGVVLKFRIVSPISIDGKVQWAGLVSGTAATASTTYTQSGSITATVCGMAISNSFSVNYVPSIEIELFEDNTPKDGKGECVSLGKVCKIAYESDPTSFAGVPNQDGVFHDSKGEMCCDAIEYFEDKDGDLYGGKSLGKLCTAPTGAVTIGGDCNDDPTTGAKIHALNSCSICAPAPVCPCGEYEDACGDCITNGTLVIDTDKDGTPDKCDGCPKDACCKTDGLPFYEDKDGDGWFVKGTGNKCPTVVKNDARLSSTNPNATEDCDDNPSTGALVHSKNTCDICSNDPDEGKIACYKDADGDGFGDEDTKKLFCEACDNGFIEKGEEFDYNDNCYDLDNWLINRLACIFPSTVVIPTEETDSPTTEETDSSTAEETDPCNVNVRFGANVNTNNINDCSLQKLKELADEAGVDEFEITSGARTPEDQARIMFYYTRVNGVAAQKDLYGWNGDQVIDVYVAEKAAGKTNDEIKEAMTNKINELGPGNVSNHCADPTARTTVDIGPTSIDAGLRDTFIDVIEQAVQDGEVHRILHPGNSTDDAFHIEINVDNSCQIQDCN